MNPNYPVYVISKGRWESRLTVKALIACGVPHRVVVEPQEFEAYSAVIDPATILQLPFSNLGQGSIPARNWVWDHAISEGHAKHWILDDNIGFFVRLKDNLKFYLRDGTGFRVIEDFAERYENLALCSMQYDFLAKARQKIKPIIFNSRCYSCILIRNDIPYRWRGSYNEDTDLSLRALKDGWCTVEFNAFLAGKQATLTMKGGNTDQLYAGDGRLKMAQSLKQQHPDVTKIAWKFGRWQHQVDYRPFRNNKLIRKPGIQIASDVDEFGMVVKQTETAVAAF